MFLNFIFQPHWRYSERGAGPARWRNRFDNTPKKVLSGGSVRPKSISRRYYQNGRPKKYYQAGLSKRYFILSARYPTAKNWRHAPTSPFPSKEFFMRYFESTCTGLKLVNFDRVRTIVPPATPTLCIFCRNLL